MLDPEHHVPTQDTRRVQVDLTGTPSGSQAQRDRLVGLLGGQAGYLYEQRDSYFTGGEGPLITHGSTYGAVQDYATTGSRYVLGQTVAYASGITGVPLAHVAAVIDAVASAHWRVAGNAPTHWGARDDGTASRSAQKWQSAIAAGHLAQAAWLAWDQISQPTRDKVLSIVSSEATYLEGTGGITNGPRHGYGAGVRYYRDSRGAKVFTDQDGSRLADAGNDSGSEEESWRARLLGQALVMLPGHANARRWHRGLVLRLMAAYAPPADPVAPADVVLHDDSPIASWLSGSNVNPDGGIHNHGAFDPNPAYMRPLHHFAVYNVLRLAGLNVTPALWHGLAAVWDAMAVAFHGPPLMSTEPLGAAGAQDYRDGPDSALQYNEGAGTRRPLILYVNDVQHRTVGGFHDADSWEDFHGGLCTQLQEPGGRIDSGIASLAVDADNVAKLAEAYVTTVVGPRAGYGGTEGPDRTILGANPHYQPAPRFGRLGPSFSDLTGEASVAAGFCHHHALLTGNAAGTFNGAGAVTRGAAILVLWRAALRPTGYAGHGFSDVPETGNDTDLSHRWARAEGVIAAASAARPADGCTRAAFVLFLHREHGLPTRDVPAAGFTDVSGETAAAVSWAAYAGVTSGTTPTTFSPSRVLTRAQLATFIYRDRKSG